MQTSWTAAGRGNPSLSPSFLCSFVVDRFRKNPCSSLSTRPVILPRQSLRATAQAKRRPIRGFNSVASVSSPAGRSLGEGWCSRPLRNLTQSYAKLRLVKRNPKTMRTILNLFYKSASSTFTNLTGLNHSFSKVNCSPETKNPKKLNICDVNRRLLTQIDVYVGQKMACLTRAFRAI
ncbi:MAG TPA: hypothetical protein VGN23_13625 [Verrucomicrobiae bacterium]|jgi:hypothetical protein